MSERGEEGEFVLGFWVCFLNLGLVKNACRFALVKDYIVAYLIDEMPKKPH